MVGLTGTRPSFLPLMRRVLMQRFKLRANPLTITISSIIEDDQIGTLSINGNGQSPVGDFALTIVMRFAGHGR